MENQDTLWRRKLKMKLLLQWSQHSNSLSPKGEGPYSFVPSHIHLGMWSHPLSPNTLVDYWVLVSWVRSTGGCNIPRRKHASSCQEAEKAGGSTKEEKPGAKHNKAGKGSDLTSVIPQYESKASCGNGSQGQLRVQIIRQVCGDEAGGKVKLGSQVSKIRSGENNQGQIKPRQVA